jgi:2-polyprenyl-6-hydroxyphenyl methylase/3-demethylubiquinone-9 3-methyltransferase
MWRALDLAASPCVDGGKLFIAIYNDQGAMSRAWQVVKRVYNRLPRILQPAYLVALLLPFEGARLAVSCLRGRPGGYFRGLTGYAKQSLRGMNRWHDFVDWVGGYPFEVAKPEDIFGFYRQRQFDLVRLTTCGGGLGCNQYVFEYRPR